MPEIIEQKGHKIITEILDDETYFKMLNTKLKEELEEYLEDHSVEELADLYEVILAILKYKNISIEDFNKILDTKRGRRGAFDNRILLKTVIEK